jgi:hypothetical protein
VCRVASSPAPSSCCATAACVAHRTLRVCAGSRAPRHLAVAAHLQLRWCIERLRVCAGSQAPRHLAVAAHLQLRWCIERLRVCAGSQAPRHLAVAAQLQLAWRIERLRVRAGSQAPRHPAVAAQLQLVWRWSTSEGTTPGRRGRMDLTGFGRQPSRERRVRPRAAQRGGRYARNPVRSRGR